MITHQELIVVRYAGADLSESEGCFVTCTEGTVNLAAATTKPAEVYGLLDTSNTEGGRVSVCLPGFHGQPVARLSASTDEVQDGDTLVLADNGAVAKGTSGTAVAKALDNGSAGELIPVRLIEPCDAAAITTVALSAATPVAVADASTAKKTTTTK